MKTLEKGHDKIKKICNALREETLEPAQKEAQEMIQKAQKQADQIIADAQKAADKMHADEKEAIERERNVFQASLSQAGKQAVEALKQNIESHFFNQLLISIIEKNGADPQLIANLINAIVKALDKEGIKADLTAIVPKSIDPRQVNLLLLQDVLKALKGQSVWAGAFMAGVQVKVADRRLTIDISDDAIKDLLSTYLIRKDFRKLIFES